MDKNPALDDLKKDLYYIFLFFIKISIFIVILALLGSIYMCGNVDSITCILKESLFIFGTIQLIIGILRFLLFSSFSSGFDAIWTPQMQGEIQRDERERQITGWSRATTGAVMIFFGIICLMAYVYLFV